MVDSPPDGRRWGASRRLEFIEFQLFWYGRFNRRSLTEMFGISAQQASLDIREYEREVPNNLEYDSARKTFIRKPGFSPVFMRDAAERYLLQAAAVKNGWMPKDNTWFEELPAIESIQLKTRGTKSEVLLRILDAIREKQQISVRYASLTGSSAEMRVIGPHSLFHSMGKWYVRCWSKERNDFRDFNLNRIIELGHSEPCGVERALDYEWNQRINVEISTNPDLSSEKRAAVGAEYDMVDGRLSIACRLSMTFYLMSQHNLNIEPGTLKPEQQQLVLVNRDDVVSAQKMARQMSQEALARGQA